MKIKRFPFYVGITTLVVITVLLLAGIFLWISHRESKAAAIQLADRLFTEINQKTIERYENTLESILVIAGTCARMPGMADRPIGAGLSHPGLPLMLKALSFYDSIFSLYAGYDDGTFLQLIAVRDQPERLDLFGAPEGSFFVLRSIAPDADDNMKQRWHFLDGQGGMIGARADLDPDYDPRERPWYVRAMDEEAAFYTEPYIFSATRLPGITCAEKLTTGGGVFGADITLERFSQSLEEQKVSANGVLFLFDNNGRIIAKPHQRIDGRKKNRPLEFLNGLESDDPRIRAIVSRFPTDRSRMKSQTIEMDIDGRAYLVRSTDLGPELKFDHILSSIAPVSDFTGHIREMEKRVALFSGLFLLFLLPVSFWVSRKIAGSLTRLETESMKIRSNDFSKSEPFDSHIKEIHSLVQAFVLMKGTIRDYTAKLIQAKEEIEALFTAVTELLADAIDAKSPYTGGHCKRVPEIAKLLVAAAHKKTTGPLKDFRMDSVEQWREFNVSAWLHDCGKITTPEYIVDKATKLETIHNRIHEIRMRFEVLLRDAEIEALRNRIKGDLDEKTIEMALKEKKSAIVEDFTFVARCNIGGEFMADENIDRLKEIGRRTWTRHLDDRLGISGAEMELKMDSPAPALPVVEPLLADKPEHIIPRINPDPFENNSHGFNMEVPDHQYNLGELYNLSIKKGTLTPEDRFKINEHIIQTILMLKKLPFPENMKEVPDIAGSHHETMIGTGYPRKLKKEDMTVPARIMAIADIFEALTAVDRPYKKPKTLGQALHIMSRMRDEQHIDAELFDLFLESGVYLVYAEKYIRPEQMDEVKIENYLSNSI